MLLHPDTQECLNSATLQDSSGSLHQRTVTKQEAPYPAVMSWAHASCTQHRTARTQDWSTAGRVSASLRAPGSTAGRKACWPEKPPWDGSNDLHAPTAALPTAPHDPITVLVWPATYQMADSSPSWVPLTSLFQLSGPAGPEHKVSRSHLHPGSHSPSQSQNLCLFIIPETLFLHA